MTIEATSKENDYSKQCVNYFQSWHMGTTNKLLQTAWWKQTHSSKQPEVGLNRPQHYYQIIQEVLYSNDLDGTEDDILWDEQHDRSDFDEEGDDMYDDTWTDTIDFQWR